MIKSKPLVSVVIPAYNVERFLYKCLLSLVNQTFKSMEIIVVNDGCTDNSPTIMREFARQYDFITVLDQQNKGISKARNAGIEAAQGEYLCFVDSDDYVSPYFVEHLYRACMENHADISCCYYYYRYVRYDFHYLYPFRCHGVFEPEEAMRRLLRDMEMQSLMWNKMYKKSLFTDYGVTFPSMCFEDMAVAGRIFAHANRVAVIDEPLYFYNKHCESTLATIDASKINDFVRANAIVRLFLERSGEFPKYRTEFHALTRKTGTCCFLYVLKMHMEKKCMRGCMANLRRLLHALRHYAADAFDPSVSFFPDVVIRPENLEKDYLAR